MATIYLDMDGVVADFDKLATEILGERLTPHTRYPDDKWRTLLQHQRFYRDLPLCRDARLLVTEVMHVANSNKMDLLFLSALPRNNDFPWAAYDKVLWAQKYFPMIPVWIGPYSHDKQLRSQPGDVLIDDREINIKEWNERGGYGILYREDVEDTVSKLKEFLKN